MAESQVLLLVVNNTKVAKGIIPGKVFENIMSSRPIFSVGPKNSDIAKLMATVGADKIIEYTEKEVMKIRVLELYRAFKAGNLSAEYSGVEAYDRKNLTKEFALLLTQ